MIFTFASELQAPFQNKFAVDDRKETDVRLGAPSRTSSTKREGGGGQVICVKIETESERASTCIEREKKREPKCVCSEV